MIRTDGKKVRESPANRLYLDNTNDMNDLCTEVQTMLAYRMPEERAKLRQDVDEYFKDLYYKEYKYQSSF